MSRIQVVGHRGAAGTAPENSLAAFQQGIELGADWLELDIQFSLDGFPVVIHDANIDRTTNGTGRVASLSLRELKQFDAGSWFGSQFRAERIPRLEEVLEMVRSSEVGVLIEIKADRRPSRDNLSKLAQVIRDQASADRIILQSFHGRVVRAMASLLPLCRHALLTRRVAPVSLWRAAGWSEVDILSVRWDLVTPRLCRSASRRKMGVWAWTVNHESVVRSLVDSGVEGIITDFPGRIRLWLDS